MKKVNLRDLYPNVYKSDYFVEVTEDVLETIRAAERAEAAYDRRMYRYKDGSSAAAAVCASAAPRTRWRSSPRRWRPVSRARPCSSSRRAPAKRRGQENRLSKKRRSGL